MFGNKKKEQNTDIANTALQNGFTQLMDENAQLKAMIEQLRLNADPSSQPAVEPVQLNKQEQQQKTQPENLTEEYSEKDVLLAIYQEITRLNQKPNRTNKR